MQLSIEVCLQPGTARGENLARCAFTGFRRGGLRYTVEIIPNSGRQGPYAATQDDTVTTTRGM